jgi:6-phosphogluconolactonase
MRTIRIGLLLALLGAASCGRTEPFRNKAAAAPEPGRNAQPLHVYVGGESGGIFVFSLDRATGVLTPIQRLDVGGNASFMAWNRDASRVYSTIEDKGRIAAFSRDTRTGMLTPRNEVPSAGQSPTHLSVSNGWVLAAHYQEPSGSVAVFGVDAAGGLVSPPVDQRAPGKWSHQIARERATGKVFVPCKGADLVAVYAFDDKTGTLGPAIEVPSATGAGPRHIDFHPSAPFAYVLNEDNVTLSPYRIDSAKGLVPNGVPIATLPPGTPTANHTGAEVVVAPSGAFVYASNRGPYVTDREQDTIAIVPIDGGGRLGAPKHQTTGGQIPRSFAIDPNGEHLVVVNLISKNVVVFRIDPISGALGRESSVTLDQRLPFVAVVAPARR